MVSWVNWELKSTFVCDLEGYTMHAIGSHKYIKLRLVFIFHIYRKFSSVKQKSNNKFVCHDRAQTPAQENSTEDAFVLKDKNNNLYWGSLITDCV